MVFLLLICFSEHINLSFKIEISDDIFMIKKPKTVFFLRKVLTKQSEWGKLVNEFEWMFDLESAFRVSVVKLLKKIGVMDHHLYL